MATNMGDYTRFELISSLRVDTPTEILSALRCLVQGEAPGSISHPFFKTPRASYICKGWSAYHPIGVSATYMEDGRRHLTVSSSFKDYDGEIDGFLDWIGPYLDGEGAEFLVNVIETSGVFANETPSVVNGQATDSKNSIALVR